MTPDRSKALRRQLGWPALSLVALSLLLGIAGSAPPAGAAAASAPPAVPAAPAATPAVPATPATASAPSAASAATAPTASTPPSTPLVFTPAALPSAQVGVRYGRALISDRSGDYRTEVAKADLPPGLELSSTGRLSGVPGAAGRFRFTILVFDAMAPQVVAQQQFTLLVGAAGAKASPAAAPAATAISVSRELIDTPPDGADVPRVTTWKLVAADLAKLVAEPAADGAAAAGTVAATAAASNAPASSAPASSASASESGPRKPAPAGAEPLTPSVDQLTKLVAPLLDVEFPTRELFEAAVAARHQEFCRIVLAAAAKPVGQVVPDDACKPPAVPPVPPAAGAPLTAAQAYEALLPADMRQALTRLARKSYEFAVAQPALWSGAGCGCGPADAVDQFYAIYPFWQAKGKLQTIDFSAFTRIGVLGMFVSDNGALAAPPHWNSMADDGLRVALRHGTRLDLVLYRNEWPRLLAMPETQQDQVIRRAAREAVASVDTKLDDWLSKAKPYLMPGWPEPRYLYDGLTVFFDYAPAADPASAPAAAADMAAHRKFFRSFMLQLIAELEQSARHHTLNIVVPEQWLGVKGSAYSIEDLLEYLERTHSLPPDRAALAAKPAAQTPARHGTITTHMLVLLREPTTDSKKSLRERLDHADALQSHTRILFLDRLLPLKLFAAGDKAVPLAGAAAFQFDADLAYFEWQFGGAALWPLPQRGVAADDKVREMVFHNFAEKQHWYADQFQITRSLCDLVCPNRTALRLLLEVLLLIGVVSIGLYLWVCRVRNLGMPYLGYLGVGGVLTAALALALLTCDPDLVELKEGNGPLITLVFAVLAGFLIRAFQRRVPPP